MWIIQVINGNKNKISFLGKREGESAMPEHENANIYKNCLNDMQNQTRLLGKKICLLHFKQKNTNFGKYFIKY